MTRNTKEIALIQIRSGKLAEMPKALHQSEFGLAKDANRLFIGNESNSELANRTVFPYQNLELLTEFTDLKDYFKYSYENNILTVNGETDRNKFKEFLPIVIPCSKNNPSITTTGSMVINGATINFTAGDNLQTILDKINAVSDTSGTYASSLPGTSTVITLVCTLNELVVTGSASILGDIGFTEKPYDISMPIRKVTEKLDDNLNITDFGIKGDNTNVSHSVFNNLIEVYKNNDDPQFRRNVFFPAGTYKFEPEVDDNENQTSAPFPLVSNLHVHGEGIDRTIISSSYTDPSVLLTTVDGKTNPSTSSAFGDSTTYPDNVIVEDMTFSGTNSVICKLVCGKNITFNRVKFTGSSSSTLVQLYGKDANNQIENVSFIDCTFSGGKYGIEATEFVKNVTITHCTFTDIKSKAMLIGSDTLTSSSPVYGFNVNGNTYFSCATDNGEDCVIKLGQNAQYVSIHQCQFDKAVIERTGTLIPYKDYEGTDRKNFCDILDINTDQKKVLMFNFAQPQWKYLTFLTNAAGQVVITVDGNDTDVTSTNGLNIVENSTSLDIRSVGTGEVKLTTHKDADITLGSALNSTDTITGNINIKKTLQLNDNKISNSTGTGDITIETANNKVIKVDETGTTPYEQLILGQDDAIPNVAYVNHVATHSYEKLITFSDMVNFSSGSLPLISFGSELYGSNIHVTNISMNVRVPFYQSFEFLDQAVTYAIGLTFYRGDVVVGSDDTYAVVKKTHTATTNTVETNDLLEVIPYLTNAPSVCYANVFGYKSDGTEYNLTETYSETYDSTTSYITEKPNIQLANKFGYTNCDEFVNQTYGGEGVERKMVTYCDANYVINMDNTSTAYTNSTLHNTTKSLRKYDEGYNYVFDLDRNYELGDMTKENLGSINLAGGGLRMKFYDKSGSLISTISHKGQLNPGGKLLLRIDFNRLEV